jgi:hypothetical protein
MGLCNSEEEEAPMHPRTDCEYPELENKVCGLHANKKKWAQLPVKEKLMLLNEIHTLMMNADHDRWAADSLLAMGYPPRQAIQPDSGPEMMLAIEMLMNTRIMTRDIEGLPLSLLATLMSSRSLSCLSFCAILCSPFSFPLQA